jgi:adenylyl- and sulfurtransferase ThiI
MFQPNFVVALSNPEMVLKSDYVKHFMLKVLRENMMFYLKSSKSPYSKVDLGGGRIFIESASPQKVIAALGKCFGIHSFFLAQKIEFGNLKDLCSKVVPLCKGKLEGTFAVRGKSFAKEFRSQDLGRELGAEILKLQPKLKVDLGKPKTEVYCLAFKDYAFIYFSSIPGPAGMPVGAQGRVVVISKAPKDKAALRLGWLLLRSGCKVSVLDFSENGDVKDFAELGEWTASSGIRMSSLLDIKKLYLEHKIKALFSTAKTLGEADEDSKKVGVKVFAPFLLLETKTPFD